MSINTEVYVLWFGAPIDVDTQAHMLLRLLNEAWKTLEEAEIPGF